MENYPSIRYRKSTSFEPEADFEIELTWDTSANTYMAHVKRWMPPPDGNAPLVVPQDKAAALLASFQNLRLPTPRQAQPIGCDGTDFEFCIHAGTTPLTFEWWCDLPQDWQELAPILKLIHEVTGVVKLQNGEIA